MTEALKFLNVSQVYASKWGWMQKKQIQGTTELGPFVGTHPYQVHLKSGLGSNLDRLTRVESI